MLKLLAVYLFAFAIAKWNQRVQATEELDAEEKRLLKEIQNLLRDTDITDLQDDEVNQKKKAFFKRRDVRVLSSRRRSSRSTSDNSFEATSDVGKNQSEISLIDVGHKDESDVAPVPGGGVVK